MEIPQLWVCRTGPFTHSSRSQMECMLGWANSEPWFWAWVGAKLVNPPAVLHPHHQGPGEGWSQLSQVSLTASEG
ncbi:rCG50805 [Rattus norvegicus]|uniref:RCG50805 n=1 Tax=Rattus norvegicus TaxID=10116 RepID=A6KC45_RAT|nr:rCG50805 [Rattus norvegicus]